MVKSFKEHEVDQDMSVARMLDSLTALVSAPDFQTTYFEKCVVDINAENERLFGATDLEIVAFYYTVVGYQAAIMQVESTGNLSKGLACYLLSFELFSADLSYVISNNQPYLPSAPAVCLFGFARAIAYGHLRLADWWAERLEVVNKLNPNYLIETPYQ